MHGIKEFIDARKDTYTKILCDLIKAKTVNPPGNEYLAARVIKKRLVELGIEHSIHEKKKRRTNLIARVGPDTGKKILFATHLDVVPSGDGWKTDPFKPVIKDGKVFGRGAADNKGPCTAVLLILEYLKSVEHRLRNQYLFVFAADEEKGSVLGFKYLLTKGIISADYAVIVDVAGEMQKVSIAEKGVLHLKVRAKGVQAHGAQPGKGVSAITAMAKLITKLDYHILKSELHKYLTRPTINFGMITGGEAPNMVAPACELVLDIRYLPSQTPESIIAELKILAEKFGEFEFENIISVPPIEVSEDTPIVQAIISVAERHGINAKARGTQGSTDAKSFVQNDIPAVGFDFNDNDVMHKANEYCILDNLFRFSEVMIDVCEDLEDRV